MSVLLFWKTVVSDSHCLLPLWVCWLGNISRFLPIIKNVCWDQIQWAHCLLLTADQFHETFQRNGLWLCNSGVCVWVFFFLCERHWPSPTRDKAANSTASACLTQRQSESGFHRETQSALRRALTTVQRTLQSLDSTHTLKHRANSPQTDGSQWQRFCLFQRVCVLTQKGLFGWSNSPSMIKL